MTQRAALRRLARLGRGRMAMVTRRTKGKTGNWKVRVRCVVTKIVYCDNCTEEEARAEPWDYAVEEHEVEQVDWAVTGVTAVK
jgi:hypothetical protein